MTPREVRYLHFSNAWVILTGVLLYGFKHFSKSQDPYSNVSGIGELRSHNLHILVAPLLVFALGMIWSTHIWPRFISLSFPKMGVLKGITGLILMGSLFPMIFTGGLIQIVTGEPERAILVSLHWVSSVIWSVASVLHLLQGGIRRRLKRRAG